MTEFPTDFGPTVNITTDPIRTALLLDDARDLRSRSVAGDLIAEEIVPSERFKLAHAGAS